MNDVFQGLRMLPQGSPPWDHDYENRWLGRRHPREPFAQSDRRQLSQVWGHQLTSLKRPEMNWQIWEGSGP